MQGAAFRAGPRAARNLVPQQDALRVLPLRGVRGLRDPQSPQGGGVRLGGGQARAGHAGQQAPAGRAVVAEVGQVKEGLRRAADVAQLPRQEGARVARHGGGGPAALGAVLAREVPAGAADAAEEALDLLHGFAEHGLPQEDVNPGVQDGVHRGDPDGLQIRVFADFAH